MNFSVRGELTQIDRDISEALAEPLAQLVRNAIVHGIETPADRRDGWQARTRQRLDDGLVCRE